MAGRNRLTGICWHEEFHTVNKKKVKAADCIYLTESRICLNKACHLYGEKCFEATHCKYRVRDGEQPVVPPQKTTQAPAQPQKIVSIDCTLQPNCAIYSNSFGKGRYLSFDADNMLIAVEFECGTKQFKYPDAFFTKHIRTHKYGFTRVCIDSKRAERK